MENYQKTIEDRIQTELSFLESSLCDLKRNFDKLILHQSDKIDFVRQNLNDIMDCCAFLNHCARYLNSCKDA